MKQGVTAPRDRPRPPSREEVQRCAERTRKGGEKEGEGGESRGAEGSPGEAGKQPPSRLAPRPRPAPLRLTQLGLQSEQGREEARRPSQPRPEPWGLTAPARRQHSLRGCQSASQATAGCDASAAQRGLSSLLPSVSSSRSVGEAQPRRAAARSGGQAAHGDTAPALRFNSSRKPGGQGSGGGGAGAARQLPPRTWCSG